MWLRGVAVLTALACLSLAVKREDFKTCDQSAFCKRHRSIQENTGYVVDWSSVKHEGSKFTAILANSDNKLLLTISGLTDGRSRVQIDEPTGALRQRFVPTRALDGEKEPETLAFDSVNVAAEEATISGGDKKWKLVVHRSPFMIDVVNEKGDLVAQVNREGKLKVEHFRVKEEGIEYPEGFWEESFKSFKDSKPFGSSSVGVDVSFVGFKHAYGLAEHADDFSLKSTVGSTDPYRLYNLDVFEYELHNPMALYVAVPYLVAHNKHSTIGALWLNAAETWIDTKSSTSDKGIFRSMMDKITPSSDVPHFDAHFISEAGLVDIFFFPGPSPQDVQKQYAKTSGVTPLPPIFALGYHQCRWNYNDEQDVAQVNAGFDEHDLPMDVLWLDIEHTDGKKYFTWDKLKFAHPKEMVEGVASKGRKMVTIIDPHIKKDDAYNVYKDAKDLGLFVKRSDNVTDFEGHCWPGASEYLDFLNPNTREYWKAQFAFTRYDGSSPDLHTWNDMNEPSVFSGPEITMDKDALHYGGVEHREVHNMYGFFYHTNTFEGLVARTGGRDRPFLLSRSGFVGTQRTAAIWTGDNTADWGHLAITVPMLLSLSVSGIPFVGGDVGGFFGNPDEQLLTRWYQTAVYQPFLRAHAHIDTRRREPWLFSEATQKALKDALRERYTLLPYWYVLFREHSLNGAPPMRPVWYEFPKDEALFAEEKAWMVGNALLVRSVTEKDTESVSVTLPGDEMTKWYDYHTGAKVAAGTHTVSAPVHGGAKAIPVWQLGGTIVPTWQRVRRAASLMKDDPLTLFVALDSEGAAKGEVYLDDMETHDYHNKDYRFVKLDYKTSGSKAVLSVIESSGKRDVKNWLEKVIIRGASSAPRSVELSFGGKTEQLQSEYDRDTQVISIRRPAVKFSEQFTVTITF